MVKEKNETTLEGSQMNRFQIAVLATSDISLGYSKGLQAMKGNSSMLKVSDNRSLQGSVDIDACTKALYPNASRWDYAVGYKDRAYLVEVHPANTSNVVEMINKAKWLEGWLKDKAVEIAKIRMNNLYWIPSGKVALLKTSPQYRRLALHRLVLTSNPLMIK